MLNDVKIIVGANYGDEGKGLLTRYFAKQALFKGQSPIVVMHNGTAQRGHTVDYNPFNRHVFHHFGSGTGDGVPTFFADSFLIHPMEFRREWNEVYSTYGWTPICLCDYGCQVITPFDMLVDHMTEDYIAVQNGEREYGSCGYGSWCATDRIKDGFGYSIGDLIEANISDTITTILRGTWYYYCIKKLNERGIDIDKIPQYRKYFDSETYINNIIQNFMNDLDFFCNHVEFTNFNNIVYLGKYNTAIFENGQGLGLDQNVDNDWHTTSNTGVANPARLLENINGYNGEVIYVTRSYLTRHGMGPLEEQVTKKEIANDMHDKTNIYNVFQGELRYGYLNDVAQKNRIEKDWSILKNNPNFVKSIALTHCNEFDVDTSNARYVSASPYTVFENN